MKANHQNIYLYSCYIYILRHNAHCWFVLSWHCYIILVSWQTIVQANLFSCLYLMVLPSTVASFSTVFRKSLHFYLLIFSWRQFAALPSRWRNSNNKHEWNDNFHSKCLTTVTLSKTKQRQLSYLVYSTRTTSMRLKVMWCHCTPLHLQRVTWRC